MSKGYIKYIRKRFDANSTDCFFNLISLIDVNSRVCYYTMLFIVVDYKFFLKMVHFLMPIHKLKIFNA